MALLIIAALFWGNCYSCPQILIAQQHQCCHHTQAPADTCVSQSLQHFVKADIGTIAPPVVSDLVEAITPLSFEPAPESVIFIPFAEAPDLFSLRI